MLLYGVPFENLLPDTRMLPAQPPDKLTPTGSIRFFFLDGFWLQAAVDGAFSIGAHSTIDTRQHRILQDAVRRGGAAAAAQARAKLRDETPPPQLTLAEPCGMLMRSAIVSGWPGLEVQAFRFTAPTLHSFATRNQSPVSSDGRLELVTASGTQALTLTAAQNDLDGVAAAINAANRGATAQVIAGPATDTFSLSVTFVPSADHRDSPLIELRTKAGDPSTNILAPFKLAPLRIERLAPDILLCIFPDVPDRLEINEPSEGLHFGVSLDDTAAAVDTISLRDPETGFNLDPPVSATIPYVGQDRARGVVDIAALAGAIATKLGTRLTRTPVGAADFGVQMVSSPEKGVFELRPT